MLFSISMLRLSQAVSFIHEYQTWATVVLKLTWVSCKWSVSIGEGSEQSPGSAATSQQNHYLSDSLCDDVVEKERGEGEEGGTVGRGGGAGGGGQEEGVSGGGGRRRRGVRRRRRRWQLAFNESRKTPWLIPVSNPLSLRSSVGCPDHRLELCPMRAPSGPPRKVLELNFSLGHQNGSRRLC